MVLNDEKISRQLIVCPFVSAYLVLGLGSATTRLVLDWYCSQY